MLLLTQIPGGLVAVLYLAIVWLILPGTLNIDRDNTLAELMADSSIQFANGLGVWVAHFLLIVLSLLVLRIVAGRDWPRQVALRLPNPWHAGLIVVLAPAFILLANVVFYVLHDRWHIPSLGDFVPDLDKMVAGWPVGVAVFLIGVMPAVSEELWCRGFLGRGLVGIHGYVAGVVMTSVLFGLIHVDPCQGGMAAVLGVLLHYVYLMTRSLVAPMLLHFLNNASSVVLSRYDTVERAIHPESLPVFVYLATGLLLVGVGFALYQSRARLMGVADGVPWQPSHPGVACPPGDGKTVVVTPLPSRGSLAVMGLTFGAFLVAMVVHFERMVR